MKTQFSIVRATAEDAPSIAKVINTVWGYQESVNLITQAISADHHTFVSKSSDGDIAGLLDCFITQDNAGRKRWELDLLAVLPNYRNLGIAGQLVESALTEAQNHDVHLIRALVRTDNFAVHRVMQKRGLTLQSTVYHLCVCEKPITGIEQCNQKTDLIPVQTFTYQGFWVEDEYSLSNLYAASHNADPTQNLIVGALIPQSDYRQLKAELVGYEKVGDYYWCTLNQIAVEDSSSTGK